MPEKKNISILLKSLLVICCMAAGMISVYLICRNITFYFKAKRYQEKLAEQRTAEEGIKAASIIFTTLPILLVYPWLQKYFVHGVMIGAIKE